MTTTDLTLPATLPGLEVTATGARPTDMAAIDADQVLGALGGLRRIDDQARWLLGDLALALVATVGEAEAWQRLAPLGHDQAHLERCVALAVAVAHDVRRPGLSWSHHHEVQRLDADAQALWLGRAEASGWSVRKLRAELKAATDEATPALPGTERLPRPPETPLRRALEQVGPDGAVLWLPGGGSLSPARVRDVQRRPDRGSVLVVVEVDAAMASVLAVDERGAA